MAESGDFGGDLSKTAVMDGIHEVVSFIKRERPDVRLVPWISDMARHRLPTILQFVEAMVRPGSMGSTPGTAGETVIPRRPGVSPPA